MELKQKTASGTVTLLEPSLQQWLAGDTFSQWRERFDRDGYIIFNNVLSSDELNALRMALSPHVEKNIAGRNDFEGVKTNRIYAMLAKSPVFAELCIHPLALAFAEADLGASCLLSACLAINLQPGESVQPWHFDDAHIGLARPRIAHGVSAFWSIDATTAENGATEVLPGSHDWSAMEISGSLRADDFARQSDPVIEKGPGWRKDGIAIEMPAGSLMLAKGTLWHRGGANRSSAPRMIITPQYCPGWMRQLENMMAAVPPSIAATLPARARELLGYSIHPPFMGYVDGIHPGKLLEI